MIDVKKLAEQAGMNVSLWDYGAGSMVFTMGIEGLARGAVERFAAMVLEAAAEEASDVSEPGWTGYECPNTFGDGVSAAVRAIRTMKPAKEQKT